MIVSFRRRSIILGGVYRSRVQPRLLKSSRLNSVVRRMPRLIDEVGNTYGRLTVLGRAEDHVFRNGKRAPRWNCVCECGARTTVIGQNLRMGHVTSCGCLAREATAARSRTHGRAGSPEHRVWKGMKARCLNPSDRQYEDYGGRGITVCGRWRDSFPAFFDDMGPRPSPEHTLDRGDVNGPYDPDNCRWATTSEQNCNKRNTRRLGDRPLIEAAEAAGLHPSTVRSRLSRGWSAAEAISGRPISPREAARRAGQPRYSTGEPCARGHISERATSSGDCLACRRALRQRSTAQ